MILRIFFYIFLLYVLYKLVVDFAIPVYKTTKRVRRSFREMQQKMQEEQKNAYQASQNGTSTPDKEVLGDYIDFEEVKE